MKPVGSRSFFDIGMSPHSRQFQWYSRGIPAIPGGFPGYSRPFPGYSRGIPGHSRGIPGVSSWCFGLVLGSLKLRASSGISELVGAIRGEFEHIGPCVEGAGHFGLGHFRNSGSGLHVNQNHTLRYVEGHPGSRPCWASPSAHYL